MEKIFFILSLLFSISTFSQSIELKNNKFYINGEVASEKDVKYKFQTTDYTAFRNYNIYKEKSGFGWTLLGLGGGLVVTDLFIGLTTWNTYPSALTYVGAASAIGSIPVLAGRKKKLKKAIEAYNNKISNEISQNDYEINFIANNRGVGLQIGI